MSCKSQSRGKSGINKHFLANLSEQYIDIIMELVNSSLESGNFYDFWKVSRVTPVPKKGKNPKVISGYRPISVGDIIGTVCEKIASAQLQFFLEQNDLIFDNQHGFRSAHSCSTAIAQITNNIRKKYHKKFHIALLIDAANAFGSPAHAVILESLKNYCNDTTFKWFETFLSNRLFYVQKDDKRSSIRSLPARGVPQGSGTGPVCFSRVFNEVLINVKEKFKNIEVIAYADDIGLLINGDSEEEVTKLVAECFEAMDFELSKKHISIAKNKTLGFKIGNWGKSDLKLRDQIIPCNNEILYLGLRLGKCVKTGDITIEPQLHHILKKMKAATHNVLAMRDYGTVKQLINLYNSFAVGFFSHGLDCQAFLDKKWYSLFQNEYCNFLKVITHKTFKELGKPISHADLLMPYNLRNFFNTHAYLGLNRLNSVFMTSKPAPLYNDLKECLTSSIGTVLRPFTGYIENDQSFTARVNRRDYFFLQNIGKYEVFMKNSPAIEVELYRLLNSVNDQTGKKYPKSAYNEFLKLSEKIWPICFLEAFNKLPSRIRSMFGTFAFKNELKNHFNTMCQHPYDPKRTFCKKCDKNENYIIKLDEARYTHKSAPFNAQKKFFFVKTKYEMFKLNLIAYHWQFKFYRQIL